MKLVDEDTEEEKTYQIVGDQEADVKSGRISISSSRRFTAFTLDLPIAPPGADPAVDPGPAKAIA